MYSSKCENNVKFCLKKLPIRDEFTSNPCTTHLRGQAKPDFTKNLKIFFNPLLGAAEHGAQASDWVLKSISHNVSSKFSPIDSIKKGLDFIKVDATKVLENVLYPHDEFISKSSNKNELFLCSTSMAIGGGDFQGKENKESSLIDISNKTTNPENRTQTSSTPKSRTDNTKNKKSMGIPFLGEEEEEERVLISEVLIKDKDGQELENSEILNIARSALKASKPNLAVTTKEVNDDIHRVIGTGYFMSCVARADETRDGFCLTYMLEPNQVIKGVIVNQANALPAKVIEEAFVEDFGKIANLHRLNSAISALDQWYYDRGLFGQVANMDLQPDGILRIHLPEAEVNNITISFRDRKTGEPSTGRTKPETLLRQLVTKKGQIYSQHLGQRDAETVFTMGIMEDVNIIPQASENGMVDLTMNVVERVDGGFSAGGGLSGNSFANGALSAIIGSFAYSHRNAFGRNQKFNVSLERGQYDSMFRINYTDPWIEGDDKRMSRSINIQNSRSPGMTVHGALREGQLNENSLQRPGTVTIGRTVASVDYSRPIRPKWSGTAGLSFQRAGARDDHGFPKLVDSYGCPLTFSGRSSDDMLIAKLETVYTDSGDNGSSQFVFNTEQGIPIFPEWLFFNRVIVRARQGMRIGPVRCIASFSGGTVIGDLAPHEAFPIGGTNSVRGYDEGTVGSGRSYIVGCGEISIPLVGPLEGALFADFGTDLGSGEKVLGNPAGVRGKPGKGYGFGAGIRLDSPLGPLRLEYACSDRNVWRFHFGIGYRN